MKRFASVLRVALLAGVVAACSGGSSGGGTTGVVSSPAPTPPPVPTTIYQIGLISDSAMAAGSCMAPLFAPGDLSTPVFATTVDLLEHRNTTGFEGDSAPMAAFPRHLSDGGPILALDTGLELTDDIRLLIGMNQSGQFVSVQVRGQPLIGPDSLSHESDVVLFNQSVDPFDEEVFFAHLDTLQPIPMWELAGHLGGDRVQIAGHFCLGDMAFTPTDATAATLSVSVEAASATQPAGSTHVGSDATYTSMTDQPLGPFFGESVHFNGTDLGGVPQTYRYRLSFNTEVELQSIVVEGAAWWPDTTISLQDVASNEILAISVTGFNNFRSHVLDTSGITGQTFFLVEVNQDLHWRYRSRISVTLAGDVIPITVQ